MSDTSKTGTRPTQTQPAPNISTEHQEQGDARRPDDALDRGETSSETIPRKSSFTHND
jgi:hypothetical protein